MVCFNKLVLLPLIISSAIAASVFASDEQSPLNVNTLPGEKPIPGDSPVAICDVTEKQLLTIDLVELSPNPPQRGLNLTVSAIGHLSEDVDEGAYVDVDVRYGYIKLISQTYDLCEQVGEVDLKCPLSKGEYKLAKTVEIPDQVPPGKYIVYARAYTKDDEFIACITATVVFSVDSSWKVISLN